MRVYFFFLSFLSCYFSHAQNYDISPAIDIPQSGWSKLLQLRNGNTLLLHLEERSPIIVKIFDKTHKEVASRSLTTQFINTDQLKNAEFDGLFEINGAAVLFLQQPIERKETLVRFRIDAVTADVIEEKIVASSASPKNKTLYTVIKRADADDYYILYEHNIIRYADTLKLVHYNERHEPVKTIPFNIQRDKFEEIGGFIASMDDMGGVCITFNLTAYNKKAFNRANSTFDEYLAIGYLPPNGDQLSSTIAQIPDGTYIANVLYAYNQRTNSLNLTLLSALSSTNETDLPIGMGGNLTSIFLELDGRDFSTRISVPLTNQHINSYLNNQTNGEETFRGVADKMFTDADGFTTIIYEDYIQYYQKEDGYNYLSTHFGNLSVTRYDDSGRELDGTFIGKEQTVRKPIYPYQISQRGCNKILNEAESEPYFEEQFAAANSYRSGKDIYVFYNDLEKMGRDSILQTGLPINNFRAANAVYYKMTAGGEPINYYLFEPPTASSSKAAFLDGADFDDKSNTLTTLVLCRHENDYTLKVAWCRLE